MDIIQTEIPDVTDINIPANKEAIADSIVENVYPLFDEVFQAKLERVVSLRDKIKTGRKKLQTEKETMTQLVSAYNKEKKITKILDRVEKLVSAGLTHEGTMKHETVILLKILDKLPEEKLNQQLSKTIQILNKRFSK